jgi:PAS domain S-box-containing protein
MVFELDRIVLLAISAASISLGIVVYQRAPDRVWNRLFTVHASSVGAWVFCNYGLQTVQTVAEAELILRLAHPVAAIVMMTLVDLAWVFPDKVERAPLSRRLGLYGIGLLFSLAALAPNLYTDITYTQGTWMVEYGWPFLAFGFFTVVALLYADYVLFQKVLRLRGVQRVQVQYTLGGLVVGQLVSLATMVILPLMGTTYFSRWGSAAYVFVIMGTGYAMAKHHLVRPKIAMVRASTFLLTALASVGVAVALVRGTRLVVLPQSVSMNSLYLIIGVLMGAVVIPVYSGVQRLLDTHGSDEKLDAVFREVSDSVLRTLDVEEIPRVLCSTISRALRPSHVTVYLERERGRQFVIRGQEIPSSRDHLHDLPRHLPMNSVIIREAGDVDDLLHRAQIFRFRSLDEARPIARAMEALDSDIIAPMRWEDELIGLVCVGSKLSGQMYEPDELQMLQNLASQASLATRNAQLYAEMARMKEYNDNILRQMKSGVIAVDAEDDVVLVNPAAEAILGLRAEDVEGKKVYVLPEDIRKCLYMALVGINRHPEFRFDIQRDDGTTVPVSVNASQWTSTSEGRQGRIAVISDRTLAEELEQKRQVAERLALIRLLSAGMAHEIRNPLVAIRTFAELLPARWTDEDFRTDFLETAQAEIDRIDGLLEQLLMLSKPADAVMEPVDINSVCRHVARAMSARLEAGELRLEMDLSPMEQHPTGDEGRIHRALLNLVANAVDAEPPGGKIRISTSLLRTEDGRRVVEIAIHNANSHVPGAELTQIFKPFYTLKPEGTGLGLAICQTIIEEHHGTINVSSDPQTGTEFSLRLPLERTGAFPREGDHNDRRCGQ